MRIDAWIRPRCHAIDALTLARSSATAANLPQQQQVFSGTASSTSVVSGRISYVFGLTGVCATVDTACSSSLVCLSFCEKGLRSRSAPEGLVCSANLIVTPEVSLMYSTANMLTADGRCKALDAAADGYVRSEACSVARLTAVDAAAGAAGLWAASGGAVAVLAVAAVAVNQDGRSSSLTAPNGVAQQGLILQARALFFLSSSHPLPTHKSATRSLKPVGSPKLALEIAED